MQDIIPNKKPRYHRYSVSTMEKKVEKSESSIKKLKEYTENKTCPKDLRYNVRVNIVPDDEFESGISHIRREAEQKLIGALTRHHHRRQKATKSSSNIWSKDQTQPEERKRTILISLRTVRDWKKKTALKMY